MMRRRYFPDFELTAHDGRKMKFYDDILKDKIVLINFMYADCQGICPTIDHEPEARAENSARANQSRDFLLFHDG